MQIYRLIALVILFCGCWLHFRNLTKSLERLQNYILLITHLMLIIVLLDVCIQHLVYQLLYAMQCTLLLVELTSRSDGTSIIHINYVMVGIGYAGLWGFLRYWTAKGWHVDENIVIGGTKYLGVRQSLECWNCSYLQFTLFPLICWLMEGFGYLNCYQLIKINEKYNCEWNKLLLRYKVRGDLLCLSVQIIYNFTSWLTVESVAECSLFWYGWSNASRIVPICYKIIVFCGPCLLTYNFYRIAIPMFKCRREDSREMLVRG